MSISGTIVSEAQYKVDLEVLDRYQAYSAEVARLATLSIVAFGFFLSFAFHDGSRTQFGESLLRRKMPLVFGVVALAAAIGFALAHRYFSTDAFSSMIRSLRLAKAATEPSRDADNLSRDAHAELEKLERNLQRSALLIAAASFCLVLGAACLALTAVTVLY